MVLAVGHKGGLSYAAIVAAVIMAALSGSAVADAAALTALLPLMMVAAGRLRSIRWRSSRHHCAGSFRQEHRLRDLRATANVSVSKLMAGNCSGIRLAFAVGYPVKMVRLKCRRRRGNP